MNDEQIDAIEKFVRSELLDVLRDVAANAKTVFDDADKVHFFGTYRHKVKEFEFLTGERIIIKEVAAYIKKVVDKGGLNEKLSEFEPNKNFKIPRKNTRELFMGKFFATENTGKRLPQLEMKKMDQQDINDLKKDLLKRIQGKFNTENLEKKANIQINELPDQIIAVIYCALCADNGIIEKELTIQRHRVKGSKLLYWNFSNMYKHLEHTHNVISPKKIFNGATSNKQTNGTSNGVGKKEACLKNLRTTLNGKVSTRERNANKGKPAQIYRKNDEIIIISDDIKKSTRKRATNEGESENKKRKNDEIIIIDDDSDENGDFIKNSIVIDDDSDENGEIIEKSIIFDDDSDENSGDIMYHNEAESVDQIDIFECAIFNQISKQGIKLNKAFNMNCEVKEVITFFF